MLNTLNFYWFGKMIETVKKRFRTPGEKKEKEGEEVVNAVVEGVELDGRVVEGGKEGVVDGEVKSSVKEEGDEGIRRRKG